MERGYGHDDEAMEDDNDVLNDVEEDDGVRDS